MRHICRPNYIGHNDLTLSPNCIIYTIVFYFSFYQFLLFQKLLNNKSGFYSVYEITSYVPQHELTTAMQPC